MNTVMAPTLMQSLMARLSTILTQPEYLLIILGITAISFLILRKTAKALSLAARLLISLVIMSIGIFYFLFNSKIRF